MINHFYNKNVLTAVYHGLNAYCNDDSGTFLFLFVRGNARWEALISMMEPFNLRQNVYLIVHQ